MEQRLSCVTLGVRDLADVCARAVAGGGRVVKAPYETPWGGVSGYLADPDGHLWEVAFNPFWPIDAAGNTRFGT